MQGYSTYNCSIILNKKELVISSEEQKEWERALSEPITYAFIKYK